MFRILSWKQLLTWIISVAFVLGCFLTALLIGAPTEYSGDYTVLTLCHWDNGGKTETDLVKEVCLSFEQKINEEIEAYNQTLSKDEEPQQPIKVEVSVISSYESQFNSIIAAQNVPDVFLVPDGNFGQWVSTGVMLDLTEYVANSDVIDLDKVWPSAVDRYRYNGKTMGSGSIYCMPKDITPYVMYYNKDMFDAYGVPYPDPETPWTPYEALDYWSMFGYSRSEELGGSTVYVSRTGETKVRDDHVYGVAKIYPESLIWSNGADYLSADRTEVLIDTPEFIEVYDYIQLATMDNCVTPTSAILSTTSEKTLFLNGQAACYIEGRSVTSDLRNQATFDWDIAPIPAFEVNQDCNGWSGSVGYAVYKNTPYPDLAYRLAEYFTSLEGQLIMTESGFSIPLYNDQEAIDKLYEFDAGQLPNNTGEWLRAAEHQRAGLWQYLPSVRWKDKMAEDSGAMFESDPSKRLTAEQFLTDEKEVVLSIIKTDFPELFTLDGQ
ncbi:MAG: sugar ABC transporter substrate-binding protein [Clostridia bacterium]|nr:sugar ABC transporter substrate-binding protein [Clostridia bacterium]